MIIKKILDNTNGIEAEFNGMRIIIIEQVVIE